MSHGAFPIDEQDLRFVLFDHLRLGELFERAPFSGASLEDAELLLKEA